MADNNTYDYIVIGIGGIGSAAVYWLKKLAPNARVLGLEQFELGHVRGGSQDYSRICRRAVGYTVGAWGECGGEEYKIYQSICEHEYEPWEELERETGLQIVYKCGGLCWVDRESGREYAKFAQAYEASKARPLPDGCERLTAQEIRARWPQLHVDSSAIAFYERDAGLVDAQMGNAAHQQRARARGSVLIDRCKVLRVQPLPIDSNSLSKMSVITDKGEFRCKHVIVSAGAWVNHVLESLNVKIPVTVTQENVTYIAVDNPKPFTKEKMPVMLYEGADFGFYTLPIHGICAFKIGCDALGPVVTGDTRNFTPDKSREEHVLKWTRKYLPDATGPIRETKTCLYTMTNDRHFVVDSLQSRGYPNVLVCQGAGHAFKFAAILGKTLAQLAIDGRSDVDVTHFSVDRRAITDASYPFWRDARPATAGAKL